MLSRAYMKVNCVSSQNFYLSLGTMEESMMAQYYRTNNLNVEV